MRAVHVVTESVVPACAAAVYRVLADYAGARRRLLSRRLVSRFDVVAGGIGGGTRLAVALRGSPRDIPLDVVVAEPEAGEVLVEAAAEAGIRRTFVLEPCERGASTRVHAVLEIAERHAGTPLEDAVRALHDREMERLARVVDDCALQDSLWPSVPDDARAAGFVPEPAFG